MGQVAHDCAPWVALLSLNVRTAERRTHEETLQVDGFGLSIGSVSVGLPAACTVDAVLLRYLDLIRLVRRNERPSSLAPGRDVDVLAGGGSDNSLNDGDRAANLDLTTPVDVRVTGPE